MTELSEQAQMRLQQMREVYKQSLPDKLRDIERDWTDCKSTAWADGSVAELKTKVHRLAGSAGLYGFDGLGLAARELDIQLADVAEADKPEKEELLLSLMAHLESAFKEVLL